MPLPWTPQDRPMSPDRWARTTSPPLHRHFRRPTTVSGLTAASPWKSSRPLFCWPPSAVWCDPLTWPPLPRIRSLAYFQPIVEELSEHPAPAGYLPYLRLKLRGIVDNPGPAKVQKSTFSDDR